MKSVDTFYAIRFGSQFMESHDMHYVCGSPYEHKMYLALKQECPCFVEDKAVWGREVSWTDSLNNTKLYHDRRQAVHILNMKKRGAFFNIDKEAKFEIVTISVTREVKDS